MLVTILICVYNGEKYLVDTLQSACNQSHSDLEILVIDDGSTDQSRQLIRDFQDKDNRIRYLYKNNGGLASARNVGLMEARGEWIAIIDQDDMCKINRIEAQLRVAETYPSAGLIFCGTDHIDGLENVVRKGLTGFAYPSFFIPKKKAAIELLAQGCFVDSESWFMRSDLVRLVGPLDERLVYACDYEYFIRLGLYTDFAYTAETLSLWRIHEGQITHNFSKRYVETRQVVLRWKSKIRTSFFESLRVYWFYIKLHAAEILKIRLRLIR